MVAIASAADFIAAEAIVPAFELVVNSPTFFCEWVKENAAGPGIAEANPDGAVLLVVENTFTEDTVSEKPRSGRGMNREEEGK